MHGWLVHLRWTIAAHLGHYSMECFVVSDQLFFAIGAFFGPVQRLGSGVQGNY